MSTATKEIHVQLYSHTDPVRLRPPFSFAPMKLCLPLNSSKSIGRKQADIAFRSKVVSRAHAEFSVNALGQLSIKDTSSSSGTFVNRTRLSATTTPSSNHILKSGDIIQLGVDYQGRQEEIFRAVVFRVFITVTSAKPKINKQLMRTALANLLLATRGLAPPKLLQAPRDAESSECCICLNAIQPMQALFISGCSHCYHYKCVTSLLGGIFWCPMCRGVSNLEESVVDSEDDVSLISDRRIRSLSAGRFDSGEGIYEQSDNDVIDDAVQIIEDREVIEISSDESPCAVVQQAVVGNIAPTARTSSLFFATPTPVNIPCPPRRYLQDIDMPGSFPGAESPLSPFIFTNSGSAMSIDNAEMYQRGLNTMANSSVSIRGSGLQSMRDTPLQIVGRVEKMETSESNDEDARDADLETIIEAMRAKVRSGDAVFIEQVKALLD